jgi:hypothetical protein
MEARSAPTIPRYIHNNRDDALNEDQHFVLQRDESADEESYASNGLGRVKR